MRAIDKRRALRPGEVFGRVAPEQSRMNPGVMSIHLSDYGLLNTNEFQRRAARKPRNSLPAQ